MKCHLFLLLIIRAFRDEERLGLLKPVLTREFSDILLSDEISRLDMNQVPVCVNVYSYL
jgi:hypothetical protein